jgi:CheY-like chemotaxis protein
VNVHDDRSGLEFRCQEHGFFAIDGLPDDREVLVQPDVFLMDINMPRMNGIKASNLIKKSWDATVIIGLCAVRDSYTIDAFMRAGASALCLVFLQAFDSRLAIVCTALIICAHLYNPGGTQYIAMTNRVFGILMLWVSAFFSKLTGCESLPF